MRQRPWRRSAGKARGGCFLASPAGFGRGPSGLGAVPWRANCPHGSAGVCPPPHTEPPFTPGRGYSGAAAIPEAASRWGETFAPPRDRTVSQCLWVRRTRPVPGRRGTFTGQCGQPLCPGETTSHLVGSQHRTVVGLRGEEDDPSSARLRQAWERGLPTRPKRDPSRTILAWPLRHRPLPDDAGCVASRRGGSSKDFRTGTAPHG